jgi:quercetin dioxygenase-like cupin family protein
MSDPRSFPKISRRDDQRVAGPMSRNRYIATGTFSDGDFGLFESELGPGANGPGAHYHEHFSESFYLLEGRLSILTGSDLIVAETGDFVYVPRDSIHGFRNASEDSIARFLILFTPGIAREQYFEGLIDLQARGATIEEIDAFARFHDQVNLRET